jgi:hypothetical protein
LKNWLGYEKRGLTLLPEDCPGNDIFLFLFFSISLSLLSIKKGLVDHVLEIDVISVEQLELNIIVQSFQEHVLLLFVSVDVFGGVSGQLNE